MEITELHVCAKSILEDAVSANVFLRSVVNIVIENIFEEKINAAFIARKIHVSRSLVYTKIEALTGQTVNEFVRSIRLERSTELLLQKKFNVTTVGYEVGFSSPSYYSRSFSRQYGYSPKEFLTRNRF